MWRGLLAQNLEKATVTVFGIAVDKNCSVGYGAKEAPKRIRVCSEHLPPVSADGVIIPPCLYDMGDVKKYDYLAVREKMAAAKGKSLRLILGGDHSVSIHTQKAYRELKKGKIGIIHIDAHADICDVYHGSKYSHACVNRRALENGYKEEDICLLGIRSYEPQEVEFLRSSKVTVYRADEIRSQGEEEIIRKVVEKFEGYDGIYLSFDIDGVDPAFAPGTGTPEHFGLTSVCVQRILSALYERLPVDVMDLVEVSPPNDINDVTTWLALKYILEILKLHCKKEKNDE